LIVVFIDLNLVSYILFHGHPVKKQLNKCLYIMFRKEFKLCEFTFNTVLVRICNNETVDVVYHIRDGLLFQLVKRVVFLTLHSLFLTLWHSDALLVLLKAIHLLWALLLVLFFILTIQVMLIVFAVDIFLLWILCYLI